jgi:ABC-2 type transport system permease protein
MTRLLSVEFRRILARRIVVVAATAALLGMLIAGVVLFARSHRLSPSQAVALDQQARAQQEQAFQDCLSGFPPDQVPAGVSKEEFCAEITQESFQLQDPRFHVAHYRDVAMGLAGLFIVILAILGASFSGAEWHAGTVATQLTWEPRRIALLAAKVLATATFAFAAFLVAEIVLFGVVAPSGFLRGTTAGVNASWFRGVVGLLLRAAVVAALAAGTAHALASLARNTAAALAVAFVYGAVLEPLLRQLRPGWRPWLFIDNVATFVGGHTTDFTLHPRSMAGAGILISLYVLGLVGISLAVFRRRDVT